MGYTLGVDSFIHLTETHMEKRMVLRFMKDAKSGRSARIWRLTRGVLQRETGMLRITLYFKGARRYSVLLRDMPAVDEVARYWLREGEILALGSEVLLTTEFLKKAVEIRWTIACFGDDYWKQAIHDLQDEYRSRFGASHPFMDEDVVKDKDYFLQFVR